MEANNLVPDSLLRRLRADRGLSNDRTGDTPTQAVSSWSQPTPGKPAHATRRLTLVMALSASDRQVSLISWLGKG